MIVQVIQLKTDLPEDELLGRAREREPRFQAIPGLIQKYYVKMDAPGHYGGIYIWDSRESMKAFRESDLAASIPGAYQLTSPPNIEIMDVLFQLRD